MNSLPDDFYDKMELTTGSDLPGRIGAVFSEFLKRISFQAIHVSNDYAQSSLRSISCSEDGFSEGEWYAETKETSKKYLNHTAIYLVENGGGPPSDPVVSQFALTGNRRNVFLWVCTSNLSKKIVEFFGLIPIVSQLIIATPVTETVERIMEKTVEKKTLNCLEVRATHQFNAATTKALLALLKQDQFSDVCLREDCDLPLERIIAEWREHHSEEMVGKMIFCETITNEEEDLGLDDLGFEECNAEEVEYLSRYRYLYAKLILRHRSGQAIYVLDDGEYAERFAFIFM